MGGEDTRAMETLLDAVDRGVLCLADAERLFGAACDLTGAEAIVASRYGERGWRRVVQKGSFTPPVNGVDEPARGAPYGRWQLKGGDSVTPWTKATALLRSIDGPVRVTFYATPRSGGCSETLLRLVGCSVEQVMQEPLALAALRGDHTGERAEVLASLPHAVITGQSVQFNDAALELLRATLGNLAGRSVQRLQRALLHAAGCAGGSGVPFVGDLRVDFLRTDEGQVALFRRAHVPTLHGHWTAPAEKMLSPRQQQVAALVMQGKNLAGIAAALEVQAETARGYLKDVYRRLGVRDRGSLTAILRF